MKAFRLICAVLILAAPSSLAADAGTRDTVAALLRSRKTAQAQAEVKALASDLARQPDRAPAVVHALLDEGSVPAATAAAESLWHLALRQRLDDKLASIAGNLLDHPDPFVAAIAEWAIDAKVGQENNGQDIRWPRPDPPAWFEAWTELSPDFLLDADYARFAIVWGAHRDGRRLLSSLGKILERATGAASETRAAGARTRSRVARQLEAIRAIQDRLRQRLKAAPDDLTGQRRLWLAARHAARPIVLANPAIGFDRLLFLTRHAAHSHRNITGSQYPWVHKPGGNIWVKTGLHPRAPIRLVLNGQLGPGHVHGLDLGWDARRVVFAYARQPDWPPTWDTVRGNDVFKLRSDQEPTHLYEIRLDGSGLRQLTDDAYWSDFEPTWAPDGTVVFASDRSGRSSECGRFSADHTVINLYARSPEGRIWRLSDNKDIDRYPHCLDDGRIAYTRWEYQERHFFEVHALWAIRPDGTQADAVFNQHMRAPFGLRDARSVPHSRKLVAVATGHHTFAYGPVVLVDPRAGINNPQALLSITPRVKPQEGPMAGRAVPQGGVPDNGGLYQTPYALSERAVLAAYSYARPPSNTQGGQNARGFALYFIDAHGNKELIHRELLHSCAFPIPVQARPRPTPLPRIANPGAGVATGYVTDVYDGLHGVPRGAVKSLRILQRVGWPLDDEGGAMRWIPGNAWERRFGFLAWAPVRVLGTVPVESDGSAHFVLPPDTAVYFQALDERGMELRRMRSHISLQPGERRGCRGCHESQARAPAPANAPRALLREPSKPKPPPWGAETLLGYEWLVQPILDRHCVRCHGHEGPDGGLDFSGERAEDGFLVSFHTLFPNRKGGESGRPLVCVSNRFSGAEVSQPRQFGSPRSPFIQVLLDDKLHRKEVDLNDDEWESLVTWVDANAPYYDMFYNRRPSEGGPPRRDLVPQCPLPDAYQSYARQSTQAP